MELRFCVLERLCFVSGEMSKVRCRSCKDVPRECLLVNVSGSHFDVWIIKPGYRD